MSLLQLEDSMNNTDQSQADLGGNNKVNTTTGHINETKPPAPKFSTDLSRDEITNRFGPYRKPTEVTIPRFQVIQEKTLELAKLIDELCPGSKEKSTALTQLVQVKMSANAAIAVNLN